LTPLIARTTRAAALRIDFSDRQRGHVTPGIEPQSNAQAKVHGAVRHARLAGRESGDGEDGGSTASVRAEPVRGRQLADERLVTEAGVGLARAYPLAGGRPSLGSLDWLKQSVSAVQREAYGIRTRRARSASRHLEDIFRCRSNSARGTERPGRQLGPAVGVPICAQRSESVLRSPADQVVQRGPKLLAGIGELVQVSAGPVGVFALLHDAVGHEEA
jgi:hypothetical protein